MTAAVAPGALATRTVPAPAATVRPRRGASPRSAGRARRAAPGVGPATAAAPGAADRSAGAGGPVAQGPRAVPRPPSRARRAPAVALGRADFHHPVAASDLGAPDR